MRLQSAVSNKQPTMPLSATAQEEAMMAWSFEHSSNAKLITNLKHEIQIVNKAFLEWFEFTLEEVIGQHAGILLRSRSLSGPELSRQIPETLNTVGEWQGEVLNQSKSGLIRPCLLSITSIYTKDGNKIGYLGVDIDLTERKKLETQIQQGEKLSYLGESVATIMHEIRNPLSGIAMNAFMLERKAIKGNTWGEGDIESIQLISKEVNRLEALVKNTLTYARNVHLHQSEVLVKEFLSEVKQLAFYQSAKNSVTIRINPVSDDLSITFDPDQMKQVFLNLISNGIEATLRSNERVVRLAVGIEEDPEWRCISSSAKVLLFSVDNTGEIMPQNVHENIFKPFFTSKEEGIGLGLATALKIVRQHNGLLGHTNLEESPFVTRFTVALPY